MILTRKKWQKTILSNSVIREKKDNEPDHEKKYIYSLLLLINIKKSNSKKNKAKKGITRNKAFALK